MAWRGKIGMTAVRYLFKRMNPESIRSFAEPTDKEEENSIADINDDRDATDQREEYNAEGDDATEARDGA